MNQKTLFDWTPPEAHFNGADAGPGDQARLRGQQLRIFELMKAGAWLTLAEIESHTGDPQASISAQLRHFRKPRFGSLIVHKRARSPGLFEYQLDLAASQRAASPRPANSFTGHPYLSY